MQLNVYPGLKGLKELLGHVPSWISYEEKERVEVREPGDNTRECSVAELSKPCVGRSDSIQSAFCLALIRRHRRPIDQPLSERLR